MTNRPKTGLRTSLALCSYALITLLQSFALAVAGAVIATALCYLARLTHRAIVENAAFSPLKGEPLPALSGQEIPQVDRLWLATVGHEPSVLLLTVMGVMALVIHGAMLVWGGAIIHRMAMRRSTAVRQSLLQRILATAGADSQRGTGATSVLLTHGVDAVRQYDAKFLPGLVRAITFTLVSVVLTGFYSTQLAGVLGFGALFAALVSVLLLRSTHKTVEASTQEKLSISDHIVEMVKGLPVLVGLGRASEQSQVLADMGERLRRSHLKALTQELSSRIWVDAILTVLTAVIVWLSGRFVLHHSMGLDTALFIGFLAFLVVGALHQLTPALRSGARAQAARTEIEAFLARPLPRNIVNVEGAALEVENLSVQYPGRAPVFKNFNMRIPHASTTAITGPSGCGKSTLLGVVSGSVAPDLVATGETEPLRVSGSVRGTGSVVWVSQSPAFLTTSVLHEVALFGFPAVVHSAHDLVAAQGLQSQHSPLTLSANGRARYMQYLRVVGLEKYADIAPESLSAGQMRRLAIARTLARVDALEKIGEHVTVLVDEPTAHLDAAAAVRVNASLAALATTGATLLIVTHDDELTQRTDFHLHATRDQNNTQWHLQKGKALGWSFPAGGSLPAETHGPAQAEAKSAAQNLESAPGSLAKTPSKHRPGIFKTLESLRILTGVGPQKIVLPAVLASAAYVCMVTGVMLLGWWLMRVAQAPQFTLATWLLVGMSCCLLAGLIMSFISEEIITSAALTGASKFRVRAWNTAGRTILSIRSLLRGDKILERLVGDIDELRESLPHAVIPSVTHCLMMVLALLTSAVLVPHSLVVLLPAVLLTTLVVPAVVLYLDSKAETISHSATNETLRLGVSSFDAAEELRANGLNYLAHATFAETERYAQDAAHASVTTMKFARALTTFVWGAASLATLVLNWDAVQDGGLSASTLALVAMLCWGLIPCSVAHAQAVRRWSHFAELVARLRPLVERNRWNDDQQQKHTAVIKSAFASPIELNVNDLSTRWPGMTHPVFFGVNATVASGEWLGITGPSGSGKTTALATLLGFLPAESGSISVNGTRMSEVDLRGYAAWCPQSAYIFAASIADNLALATQQSARPSEAQMLDAMERVGLGDFVRSLPQGLNTQVGAGGAYVSGGQRQRIAIARTLLTDAALLLMDEPTAHLDQQAAAALIQEVAQGTKATHRSTDSTRQDTKDLPAVVIVSHRASDLQTCDRLVHL